MSSWRLLGGGLLALVVGCAPAGKYDLPPAEPVKGENRDVPPVPPPPPSDYAWLTPDPEQRTAEVVPIQFLHERTHPKEWAALKSYWNESKTTRPEQSAAFLGLSPLMAGALAGASPPARVIQIKIPPGLDPIGPEQLPAYNPPTLAVWALGKRLFFDEGILTAEDERPRLSCAGCHQPSKNFTDGRPEPLGWRINTPTLLNVVYNRYLFWDGRANSLEEVVQRLVEDDREIIGGRKTHVWTGVVRRLRDDPGYEKRFRQVYGTPPTQDTVGKALATYLRTILSGNSLHDRAERARRDRKGTALEPADYVQVLDDASMRSVLLEPPDKPPQKDEVARQLHLGYTLFHGQARCSVCHAGGNFTDNGFHNLGLDLGSRIRPRPGVRSGRFDALPPGQKDWSLVGAYKTPTLRGLLATPYYFHTGTRSDLFEVVRDHVKGTGGENPFLDPLFRDPKNPLLPRDFGLKEEEVRAVTMFLKALDGEPPDRMIADPEAGLR